jgi:sortase A
MRGGRIRALSGMALVLFAVAVGGRPALRVVRHEAERRTAAARWSAWRSTPAALAGSGVCWVRMPAIGMYVPVSAGGDLANGAVEAGVGDGLTVMLAHRDRHFRPLRRAAPGQEINVDRADGSTARYRVVETEVLDPASAGRRLDEKCGEPWLVLLTCHPFGVLGPAPDRFLVWARPTASDARNGGRGAGVF